MDLGAENRELSADENFIQARNEYESLKATLLTCFQHPQAPGAEHKIVVAVLSKYVTTILANQIHKILNLAFHPETVENVAPDGSTWPNAAIVSKVLHAETVVYSHMLDTSKWTLHPIELSEKSMTGSVLAAASLNFKTGSSATLRGLLGTMLRHIHAALVSIISKAGSSARSVVTYVPCPFEFFAYLIYITDADEQIEIEWIKKEKAWLAGFKGQQSLYKHLGVGWESVSKEERYVKVIGGINVRYSHRAPDNAKFTMLQVNSGVQGGIMFPSVQTREMNQRMLEI